MSTGGLNALIAARMYSAVNRLWGLGVAILLLVGCSGGATIPVINKSPDRVIPAERVVRANDSIYTIAWEYGVDYLDIADWNSLRKPYALKAGQRVRLRPGAATTAAIKPSAPVTRPLPQPVIKSTAKPATSTINTSTAVVTGASAKASQKLSTPKNWLWPAKGKVIEKYSRDSGVNGIRIGGAPGTAIRATAYGEVVYVGDGLPGYGKLIIIKHSEEFLSAYAHNRKILVAEGQRVEAGFKVAEMGNSGSDRTMLHFEIRLNGKPKDPLGYLKS